MGSPETFHRHRGDHKPLEASFKAPAAACAVFWTRCAHLSNASSFDVASASNCPINSSQICMLSASSDATLSTSTSSTRSLSPVLPASYLPNLKKKLKKKVDTLRKFNSSPLENYPNPIGKANVFLSHHFSGVNSLFSTSGYVNFLESKIP